MRNSPHALRLNIEHFHEFRRCLESGRRADAARSVNAFIGSFAGLDEKIAWTKAFLDARDVSDRIRHELYENVVFPALLDGYRRGDTWSLWWLARTMQNLYASEILWRQVDFLTAEAFLRALLLQHPDHEDARRALLARLVDGLRYAVHEWPRGILYGRDGATLTECDDLGATLAEARRLDSEQVYSNFLDDFQRKLREYAARLKT